MKKLKKVIVIFSVFLLFFPALVYALPATHDRFFLRYQRHAIAGGSFINEPDNEEKQEYSANSDNTAPSFAFHLGWSLNENVALHVGRS